jgi:hypothetical protein
MEVSDQGSRVWNGDPCRLTRIFPRIHSASCTTRITVGSSILSLTLGDLNDVFIIWHLFAVPGVLASLDLLVFVDLFGSLPGRSHVALVVSARGRVWASEPGV